ncbi:MAG: FkbM family methyltransferase [Desulfobacterales bacterium]|nr:MAG: FkbM family methyltransferase [Desulfobacterales bacterium]
MNSDVSLTPHGTQAGASSLAVRILIIQENGRHARNREFRECFALQRALAHAGVVADIWGKGHANFEQPFKDFVARYDAIISLENYDSGWHPHLAGVKLPKAFWCIDAHTGVSRYLDFVRRNRFDIVFSSTEYFADLFKTIAGKTIWLPNAYDSFLIDRLYNVHKTVPLGFCGNTVNRRDWIDYLQKRWGLRHAEMVIGPDMVRAINSYQIHWNRNASIDINYRTFETLGCGTFLLTNYTPGLEKLFTIGEHLVVYNDREDLDQKITYYQTHSAERLQIARNGYEHVRKHHKYIHRAQKILETFDFKPKPQLRKPDKEERRVFQGVPQIETELKYFSQYKEEDILWRVFRNQRDGFLVDVGAADGVRYSNSRDLLVNYNWRGLLIEPHPDFFDQLESLYRDNPKVKICPYAIDTEEKTGQFYMFGRDKHAQISTLSKSFKERAQKAHGNKYLDPIDVQCKPLGRVLKEFACPSRIDFISIDCEGLDMQVLQSMDWTAFDVRLVCVEQSMPEGELQAYMHGIGYSVYDATAGNCFFIKDQ